MRSPPPVTTNQGLGRETVGLGAAGRSTGEERIVVDLPSAPLAQEGWFHQQGHALVNAVLFVHWGCEFGP